jgi:cytidylate kinase
MPPFPESNVKSFMKERLQMAVITFSRQVASGGDEIAARVCDLLGYRYFDKRIMLEVAAEVGLSEQEIVDFSEERYEVRNFLSRLFRAAPSSVATVPVWQEDASGQRTLTLRQLDAEQSVNLVRHTILAAYGIGNIVIVGRGGQVILSNRPDVLHVRVISPMSERIKYLQRQGHTGIAEIKLKINQQDRATAEYLSRFYGVQVDDPALYHLVINTGRMDIESAAGMIVSAAQKLPAHQAGTAAAG